MIKSKYKILIQKEIDKTISVEEKTQLAEYINTNTNAKNVYNSQRSVSQMLEDVTYVDPPSDMKKNIISALNPDLYAAARKNKSLKKTITFKFSNNHKKLSLAFVGGLTLGILIFTSILDSNRGVPVSDSHLMGTIGADSKALFKPLSELTIELPEIKGEMRFAHYKKYIKCEVNLNSIQNFSLVLEFDSTQYRLLGFLPKSGNKLSLEHSSSSIISNHSGGACFELFLQKKSAANSELTIILNQKGKVLYRKRYYTTQSNS